MLKRIEPFQEAASSPLDFYRNAYQRLAAVADRIDDGTLQEADLQVLFPDVVALREILLRPARARVLLSVIGDLHEIGFEGPRRTICHQPTHLAPIAAQLRSFASELDSGEELAV